MGSVGNIFQAKSNHLVGLGGFFSIDKRMRKDGVGYLRDRGNNIIGFTSNGKHVFLENVQKDNSGALFKTAKYQMSNEDVNKIIDVFVDYSKRNKKSLSKSNKHLFVQVKNFTFIDKFMNLFKSKKTPKNAFEAVGQKAIFKRISPFVDLIERAPKLEKPPISNNPKLNLVKSQPRPSTAGIARPRTAGTLDKDNKAETSKAKPKNSKVQPYIPNTPRTNLGKPKPKPKKKT